MLSEYMGVGDSSPLDRSPKQNWVEKAGGLPPYVREIARSISKKAGDLSRAIAIAIGRIKVWASGKGVTAKTQAKAAKALAQWEKAKAKNGVKDAAEVAASATDGLGYDPSLLTAEDYALLEAEAATISLSWTATDELLLRLAMERSESSGEDALARIALAAGSQPTKTASSGDGSGKHDLVFFKNRSTPKVLPRGAKLGDYPDSYGPVTSRRAATSEDERKIASGGWLRKDESGNKPSDSGYKKTKVRPGLVS